MKKLINSVDGAVTDVLGGDTGALRGRAHRSRGVAVATGRTRRASVSVPAGRAATRRVRTVDDADRPEITRSWGAPVHTPALRWES